MATSQHTEIEQLRAELARLREENDELRRVDTTPPTPSPAAPPASRGPRRWRAWVSALCIVIAAILVPVSVVGGWTRAQLVDEQRFVDTFGPLAQDPDVQALVVDRASTAIDQAVDIDGLTNDLFDGIAALDLPPAAQKALGLLRGPAASGARSMVTSAITKVVQSDAFAAVWDKSLVATHRALVAAATGSDADAVAISGRGELTVQLGPVIDELKTVLAQQGFGFANAIPSLNVSVVVAQADALTLIGPLYTLAATLGYVIPFISLAFFALGVLVARRRSTAVLGAGVGMVLAAGAFAVSLSAGGLVLSMQAASLGVPASTLQTIYDTVTGRMHDSAIVLVVLGAATALAAWLGGRWLLARRVRTLASSLTTSARRGLQARGLATGRFGVWLHRQRLLVRIALLVLALLVLVVADTVTVGLVLGTVAVALVVWLVLELLSRAPGDPAPPSDEQIEEIEEVMLVEDAAPDDSTSDAVLERADPR